MATEIEIAFIIINSDSHIVDNRVDYGTLRNKPSDLTSSN